MLINLTHWGKYGFSNFQSTKLMQQLNSNDLKEKIHALNKSEWKEGDGGESLCQYKERKKSLSKSSTHES